MRNEKIQLPHPLSQSLETRLVSMIGRTIFGSIASIHRNTRVIYPISARTSLAHLQGHAFQLLFWCLALSASLIVPYRTMPSTTRTSRKTSRLIVVIMSHDLLHMRSAMLCDAVCKAISILCIGNLAVPTSLRYTRIN